MYQTIIHITFLLSALAIAGVDRLMPAGRPHRATAHDASHPTIPEGLR